MDAIKLSPRLQAVAEFVPARARLVDIGSDHAYLPAHLLLNQHIAYAVAGEVAVGPFQNAQQTQEQFQFGPNLVTRLGDGFAVVQPEDQIDTAVIAGMGGQLINKILTAGLSETGAYEHLILQPNTDVHMVREWLQRHHYQLVDETILFDDGHYYEILVAQPGEVQYSPAELMFGPFNLKRRPAPWQQYWQRETNRLKNLLVQMQQAGQDANSAYQAYENQLNLIEEVLN
ncbi:tRNA (adenine(22)-N(1))-methyltransferase [Weissella kandleri]|uniref:tRNA (adenine(22)-N(1))-methyltransferase n=1 Tax=Weissella kandleri TaxID=1616 RepID=UPI00387E4612